MLYKDGIVAVFVISLSISSPSFILPTCAPVFSIPGALHQVHSIDDSRPVPSPRPHLGLRVDRRLVISLRTRSFITETRLKSVSYTHLTLPTKVNV